MSAPVLDPDLLKAFVAVADQRSFTRAAMMLNRTQSAVSMQIKRLEDRLGVALFSRTTVETTQRAARKTVRPIRRPTHLRTLSCLIENTPAKSNR